MQDACKTPWSDARQTDSYPVNTVFLAHKLRPMGDPNNNSQTTQILIKLIGLKLNLKCDYATGRRQQERGAAEKSKKFIVRDVFICKHVSLPGTTILCFKLQTKFIRYG